jgi:putative IMPACT (imprinted ancient) family translation regulator
VEEIVQHSFSYPQMNDVMRIVKDMQPRIISQTYEGASCNIVLSIRKSEASQLRSRLQGLL